MVSYAPQGCAHTIKGVRVAHGCRASADLQQPSLLDDRRAMGSWERMAPRAHGTRTLAFVAWSPAVCAEDRASPSWMQVYLCNICGVQSIVADTSPLCKPPYGGDDIMRPTAERRDVYRT